MHSVSKYGAGFVGKRGGDIQLLTSDREEALAWTGKNTSKGTLAVLRGFTEEDVSLGVDYMNSILVTQVIGFDGEYTKGYLYQLSQERAVRTSVAHSSSFYDPIKGIRSSLISQ